MESLDDLFDDEPVQSNENDNNTLNNNINNKQQQNINTNGGVNAKAEINQNKDEIEAPMLPQDDETKRSEDDIMSVDVQKELEAKFDELFGAFDEDEN